MKFSRFLAAALFFAPFLWAGETQIQFSPEISNEGFVTASWEPAPAQNAFTLQMSTDPGFAGTLRKFEMLNQEKAHLSGFDNGTYYARLVDAQGSVLSNVGQFEVKHRDLGTAWFLFLLGGALFAALVITIVRFLKEMPEGDVRK